MTAQEYYKIDPDINIIQSRLANSVETTPAFLTPRKYLNIIDSANSLPKINSTLRNN